MAGVLLYKYTIVAGVIRFQINVFSIYSPKPNLKPSENRVLAFLMTTALSVALRNSSAVLATTENGDTMQNF